MLFPHHIVKKVGKDMVIQFVIVTVDQLNTVLYNISTGTGVGLAGLIGENVWLLLVLALITIVVAVEMGIIGKVKNSINNAINGLESVLQNLFSFYDYEVIITNIAKNGAVVHLLNH